MRWKETHQSSSEIMENMFDIGGSGSNINNNMPVLELRDLGSSIEVMLISGVNKNFMLYEVITVLEEEGAEVVSANFSTVGDKIFHTVHAQVTNSFILFQIQLILFHRFSAFCFFIHVLMMCLLCVLGENHESGSGNIKGVPEASRLDYPPLQSWEYF